MSKVFSTGHSKGQEICNRTRAYALRIIRLYQSLRKDEVGRVLGRQLLRSGTSIGANVEEAQAGQSPADFVAKMSIASSNLNCWGVAHEKIEPQRRRGTEKNKV